MPFFKSARSKHAFLFLVFFFLLAFYVSRLFLYLDDVSYIFPAASGKYLTHFFNYLRDNGFNRPFALFYYYFIFTFYLINSKLAHLLPLTGYVLGGTVLYKILTLQGLNEKKAFFTSMAVLAFPFGAEIYSWFSASVGVWALIIFYLEVFLIEKFGLRWLNLILILLLQFLVSFFYETTLFMALPLAYLLTVKASSGKKFKFSYFLKNLFLLFLPVVTYLSIKISVPHTIPSEFEISRFSEVTVYFGNFIRQFIELFWTKGPILFWLAGISQGLSELFLSPLPVLMFLLFSFLLFAVALKSNKEKNTIIYRNRIHFWILVLVSACLPLIWKKYYLPFRTLYLPSVALLILVSFSFFNRLKSKSVKILIPFLIIFFFLIQIAMLRNYQKQYLHDEKIAVEIRKITENFGFNSEYRTNLLLRQIPHNTGNQYIYGDYLISLFNQSWTAVGFMDLNSGTIKNIAIDNPDLNIFVKGTDITGFMTLKPLVILDFNGIENCYIKRCFNIFFHAN